MNHENPEVCRACGGDCCKRYPGCAYPEDFDNDPLIIKAAIRSERWAIDWWEGDPGDGDNRQAYFVRPAVKGFEGQVYHPLWSGTCTFHTEAGCTLPHDCRPKMCRDVVPEANGKCEPQETSKDGAAIAWRPFHDLLNSFH